MKFQPETQTLIDVADTYRKGNNHITEIRLCACGCGRRVYGRAKTSNAACRKRLSIKSVIDQGD